VRTREVKAVTRGRSMLVDSKVVLDEVRRESPRSELAGVARRSGALAASLVIASMPSCPSTYGRCLVLAGRTRTRTNADN